MSDNVIDDALVDFAAGYTLGYETGREIGWTTGYRDSEIDHERAWLPVARRVRVGANDPSTVELERLRTPDFQPCPTRCSTCSRCIASRAYWARGGRQYLGQEQEAALAAGAS